MLLIQYFLIKDKPIDTIGPDNAFGIGNKFNIDIYFDDSKKLVLEVSNDNNYSNRITSKYTYDDILGDTKDILFKTGNYNQLDGSNSNNKNKFSIISFYKMNISKK